ncbi:hypothetical protein BsWGS_13133 [Bradybaena similaris]
MFAGADDECTTTQCLCSRNPQGLFNDVKCFVNSITPSDDTITSLPSGVQSLILSCNSRTSLSIFSEGIFEKFTNLTSLAVEQCNINTLTAQSFRGLTSLLNLTISKSVLPILQQDMFMHISSLQHLSIIYCNMTALPDISHLKYLQSLNISHNNLSQIEVALQGTSSMGTYLSEKDSVDSSERTVLGDVRIIDVSFNKLFSTPVSLIERTPHVQELYLIGLSLTQLLFPGTIRLQDLVVLDARQNLLQSVDFQSLGMASKMRELRLEGAGLPLRCDGLSSLVNLEELSLNNFGITDAIWQELNSTVLGRLNLISNNLTSVGLGALPALRILHLAENKISFLSNLAFINQTDLLLVNFSGNQIQSLPADLFQTNFHLKAIDFAGNRFAILDYGTFRGLNELFYLDLRNNLLSYLPFTIFKGLTSMAYLYLSGNQLKDLPKLSYMSELYTLDISSNRLSMIGSQQLAGLDKLESLFVNDNHLTILPPNLFAGCPSLLQVYLHNNRITDLGSLGTHPSLAILTLNDNQLGDFIAESPFIHLPNLQYLFLDSNNLTTLKSDTFPPSIVSLVLDKNSIAIIYPGTFSNLYRLSFVQLTGNKVVLSIPLVVVNVFKMLSPKPMFNLERNVFLCDCNLSYLKAIYENGSSVRVFRMYYPQFVGLENTKCYNSYWGEEFRPFTKVPSSQFVCEFTDSWCAASCNCCFQNTSCDCLLTCPSACKCASSGSGFTKFSSIIRCTRANLSQVPAGIAPRTVSLYLDGNQLSHLSKEDFSSLRDAEEIYLNNSAVELIDIGVFDSIPALKTLLLNDNLLTTIPEHLFGTMKEMKELYLHNNLINSISPMAFSSLASIERITLHNNKLVLLTSALTLPRQMSLTLSDNPWSCDCDVSKATVRAVYEMSQVIEDAEKMCCVFYNDSLQSLFKTDANKYSSPEGKKNPSNVTVKFTRGTAVMLSDDDALQNFDKTCFPLLSFNYEDYCIPIASNSTFLMPVAKTGFHPGFIALIVITTLLLLTASAVVLILLRRREIQAWLFVRMGVRILDKKAKLDKEDAGCKVFDAFISHSSRDAEFVATTLAPALENGDRKYRLCIHYRDFPVGRNITDTICRAIENSSRTVLLLSVHFLSSEWCRFEFQTAHHHILREGSHRLIIIVLEDIPDQMLDPDLKVHLMSKTYLRFGDPWFWEKLYFAMPSIKDRRGDNDSQRLDVLHGMRILANDDEAADNQENEVRHKYGSQALNVFNQLAGNQTECLQDHANRTEEMNYNCHRKPAENPEIMGFHNMNAGIIENDVDAIVNDVKVDSEDKVGAGDDDCCILDEVKNDGADKAFRLGGDKYLPPVLDFLNQNYSEDDNNGNFQEGTGVSIERNTLCLNHEIRSESRGERKDDNPSVNSRKAWIVTDEEKDAGGDDIQRDDRRCIACDVDDADQTCAYTVDDARTQPHAVTLDNVDESRV